MPTAEIITIGTELLLGEIQDTNTRYLARTLRDCGVDLYRTMTVGDNEKRISQAIQEALHRSNIIITTGGLGPTVDDPTRQAIAMALGVELEFQPHLWDQIQARFQQYGRIPGENNKRQAFIPYGALPIQNPVGTAPAFIFEQGDRSVIALPGVPREMEYLTLNAVLPYLREHFHIQEVIKARVLHTASIGESQVDELVGDLELLSNPTVGLLAHPGQVDIRVTAKAPSIEEADRMISEVIARINQRLPDQIFGMDEESLEGVMVKLLASRGLKLALIEAGLGGELVKRLAGSTLSSISVETLPTPLSAGELFLQTMELRQRHQSDVSLGVSLMPIGEKQNLDLVIISPEAEQTLQRSYGGPPLNAPEWAVNTAIDLMRRQLLINQVPKS
jgi:competence/damage-inducible protein CinA-like protein